MPDFDVDFCTERRQEVIEYVRGKYGYNNVSQIVTFGTFDGVKGGDKGRCARFQSAFQRRKQNPKLIEFGTTIAQSLGLQNNKDGVNVGVRE